MDILPCPVCNVEVFPEATTCANGHDIAYDPDTNSLRRTDVELCTHRDRLGCSWISADAEGGLCLSCAMTSVTPHLSADKALDLWATTEAAKRWVLVGLVRMGWFSGENDRLPDFKMLSERIEGRRQQVMMGHLSGVITLNIMEADPAIAYHRKDLFDEPIRNMIGHIRHEVAHFLFEVLLAEEPEFAAEFRALMGDERKDYGAALKTYYKNGAPEGWQQTHISEYATAHAHENWAEHAAHAMHLEELAQSARDLGLRLEGEQMFDRAQTAGVMLNHMCRALGQPDPYPMVISPQVREKLDFCLKWLDRTGRHEPREARFDRFRTWLVSLRERPDA